MARRHVGSVCVLITLLACGGDEGGGDDGLTTLTSTAGDSGPVTDSGGVDDDGGTSSASASGDGGEGGDDGGEDGGGESTSGAGEGDTGPDNEEQWEIDDQWDSGRRITLTNGRYDFTFGDEMVASASDVRLTLDVQSRGSAFEMGMNFNKEIGINEHGGSQFYTFPGPVTSHAIESEGSAAKRITFEFAGPSDSNSASSRILGTSVVEVVVRWDGDRLDVDLEHPITTEFGNHNGFTAYFLDQRGFPYTLVFGVEGSGGFSSTETAPGHPESVVGYFVDEQGMLGMYQGGAPGGSRATWKDYYAVEKGGRSILVYTPDFRDLAVTGTYDGAGYYQNLVRPWGEFVFAVYSQTTLGAQFILAPVPAGEYHDRLRLLLDQPTPADPGEYDDWLEQLQ